MKHICIIDFEILKILNLKKNASTYYFIGGKKKSEYQVLKRFDQIIIESNKCFLSMPKILGDVREKKAKNN